MYAYIHVSIIITIIRVLMIENKAAETRGRLTLRVCTPAPLNSSRLPPLTSSSIGRTNSRCLHRQRSHRHALYKVVMDSHASTRKHTRIPTHQQTYVPTYPHTRKHAWISCIANHTSCIVSFHSMRVDGHRQVEGEASGDASKLDALATQCALRASSSATPGRGGWSILQVTGAGVVVDVEALDLRRRRSLPARQHGNILSRAALMQLDFERARVCIHTKSYTCMDRTILHVL